MCLNNVNLLILCGIWKDCLNSERSQLQIRTHLDDG